MPRFSSYFTDIFDLPFESDLLEQTISTLFEGIGLLSVDLAFDELQSDVFEEPPPAIIDDDAVLAMLDMPQTNDDVDPPPTTVERSNRDVSTIPVVDGRFTAGKATLSLKLRALTEIIVGLAGLDGFEFVLNPGDFDLRISYFDGEFRSFQVAVGFGLRLSPDYLQPMRKVSGSDGKDDFEQDPDLPHVQIEVATATFTLDATGNIDIGGSAGFSIETPVMIGSTGIILENLDMELNLSGTGSRPDGIPAGWKGLMINNASLRIPSVLSGAIVVSRLGIGSGGVSGTIQAGPFALNYDPDSSPPFTGDLVGEVFGMQGGLKEISLTLQQNIPARGSIRAQIMLPFLESKDEPLDIDIGLTPEGGFTTAVHRADGIQKLAEPGFLSVQLDSIGFARENDVFTACLGGEVTPLLGDYDWPTFRVDALCIDSTGKVSMGNVWADFDPAKVFELSGMALEISKAGFGSEDDGTRWIGFYAGLKLANPLPMSGSVEGLRINRRDGNYWLSLEGAGVGFEIPDTVEFKGRLGLIRDDNGISGFRGGGKLTVIPTNLVVDAELIVARIQGSLAVYTFSSVQLPVGIPIGNTGAAFYGFAGLMAFHMGPAKEPGQAWWDDWYLKPKPGVADSRKWEPERDSFALGAGTTIGTASDDGYAVNAKLLWLMYRTSASVV